MKPQELSVVLTGATDPVGAALARAFVKRGARVLLIAKGAAPLVVLARELSPGDDHRYRVDALAADITTAHGCRAVFDVAIARNANALVNAPGADESTVRDDLDPQHADPVAQRNLFAAVEITNALLRHLLCQPEARVLNIGPAPARRRGGALTIDDGDRLRGVCEALRREVAGSYVRIQFLGRRASWRWFDAQAGGRAGASRNDRPEYIASVALEMLVAGTSERFLGIRGDMLGRLKALVSQWFDPAPRHRRA